VSRARTESLVVRASRSLLTRTVRGRATEGTVWGEALLGEFEAAAGPRAAVWWTVTSLPLAWRERRNARRAARMPVSRRAGITRRAVLTVAGLVVAGLVTNSYLVTVVYEPSASMAPTYGVSSRSLVDKIGFRLDGLRRGDVVVLDLPRQYPDEPNVIKRVAGLPGDHMGCTASGALTRDGVVVAVGTPGAPPTRCPSVVVPAGDVYLIRDNVSFSVDSREFGAVPQSSVVGRVMSKVWPL